MEIRSEDAHEEMALDYQCLAFARLNETLKKHGITDQSLRRQICEDYLFDEGYFFDAGWFEHDGTRLYPQLCFAERMQDPAQNLGDVQVLYVPSQEYDLHEAVFGNAGWYFEEHGEDASEIKTGSYQQADEAEAVPEE